MYPTAGNTKRQRLERKIKKVLDSLANKDYDCWQVRENILLQLEKEFEKVLDKQNELTYTS